MKISEILNEENNQKLASGLKFTFYIDDDEDYNGVPLPSPYEIGGRVMVSDLSIFRPQPQELSKKNDSENPLDDIQSNKFGNGENEFYNIRGKMQSRIVKVGNTPARAFYGTLNYINAEDVGYHISNDDEWFWEDGSAMPLLLVYNLINESLYPLIYKMHGTYPDLYSMRDLPVV